MRGVNQVYVVTAAPLKREHHAGQICMRDIVAVAPMIDFPVLAKTAQRIAVGKENGSRPAGANQRTFLTEVRAVGGHLKTGRGATESCFVF
jgi:hypothetical protein